MERSTEMHWSIHMDNIYMEQESKIHWKDLKDKIIKRGDLSYISIEDQLKYIDELSQFPLGQILLEKGSIDTFWTDFIISGNKKICNKLEDFILNRSPFTLAWREVLQNFKRIAQKSIKDNMILASIPCGAMRELLELDYSQVSNVTILGIDIDPSSLSLAKELADKRNLSQNLQLYQHDAWQLPYNCELDLITSCGLNIYVSDKQKVLDLYRQFFKALKPKGKLIIGFLTYPPYEEKPSEWRIDHLFPEDILLEKILYKDILDVQWHNFRTSWEFENELKEVGFSEIRFFYDKLYVFPTVVAIK
jgi:SAM-dependent methyltransferase